MLSPKYLIINPLHISFETIPKGLKCETQTYRRMWCIHPQRISTIKKYPKKPISYGLSSFR